MCRFVSFFQKSNLNRLRIKNRRDTNRIKFNNSYHRNKEIEKSNIVLFVSFALLLNYFVAYYILSKVT